MPFRLDSEVTQMTGRDLTHISGRAVENDSALRGKSEISLGNMVLSRFKVLGLVMKART